METTERRQFEYSIAGWRDARQGDDERRRVQRVADGSGYPQLLDGVNDELLQLRRAAFTATQALAELVRIDYDDAPVSTGNDLGHSVDEFYWAGCYRLS